MAVGRLVPLTVSDMTILHKTETHPIFCSYIDDKGNRWYLGHYKNHPFKVPFGDGQGPQLTDEEIEELIREGYNCG